MNGQAQVELPTWRSHKVVHAAQIVWIEREARYLPGDAGKMELDQTAPRIKRLDLHWDGEKRASVSEFPKGLFDRYSPKVGDFYVVYEDGYTSISPHTAFVEGYSRT